MKPAEYKSVERLSVMVPVVWEAYPNRYSPWCHDLFTHRRHQMKQRSLHVLVCYKSVPHLSRVSGVQLSSCGTL